MPEFLDSRQFEGNRHSMTKPMVPYLWRMPSGNVFEEAFEWLRHWHSPLSPHEALPNVEVHLGNGIGSEEFPKLMGMS
jgi:hypothetical protein